MNVKSCYNIHNVITASEFAIKKKSSFIIEFFKLVYVKFSMSFISIEVCDINTFIQAMYFLFGSQLMLHISIPAHAVKTSVNITKSSEPQVSFYGTFKHLIGSTIEM